MPMYLLAKLTKVFYDETSAFVVRAKNEVEARAICSEKRDDSSWGDPTETSCEIVEARGKSEIILEDFNNG